MEVSLVRAMRAQTPDPCGSFVLIREQQSGVAAGAQILRRIETECRDDAERSRGPAIALGEHRLRRVLDNEIGGGRELFDPSDLSVEIHGDDRASLLSEFAEFG